MIPLNSRLSQNGFTSSENYDYAVQCFLKNPTLYIRCLHIDGDCGRRRTAFAHALANALESSQVLYHEFGKDKPTPQIIRIMEGAEIVEEPPVDALDRVLTEACAQSEAESTVLVLDQLHKTPFLNHIRLFEFIQTGIWQYSNIQFQANVQNLSVYLISDESLYHSLQNCSFRLWVSGSNRRVINISADDLGLEASSSAWLAPMQKLLKKLQLAPTLEEYHRLAFDMHHFVYDKQHIKASLFGWVEGIDRTELNADELIPYLDGLLDAVLSCKGEQEEIEISGL